MDTEHPLYNVLKEYYTNTNFDSSNFDNSLLFQYIEDTCGVNVNDYFNYFKTIYSKCNKMYFVNVKTTTKTKDLYCYFTNELLNKIVINDFLFGKSSIHKYEFIHCNVYQYKIIYVFLNTYKNEE